MYPDDLVELSREIKRRQIADYKMQLAIVQNPHAKDPRELWEALKSEEPEPPKPAEFDTSGFDRLRFALAQNPRFIVKP